MKERKQSTTTYPMAFFMTSSTDHISGVPSISPTVTIRKAGGSFASPSGAVTEIANGWYELAGNATDRNTLGELLLHATGTGCDPVDEKYIIVPYDPFDGAYLGLTGIDDLETRLSAARAGYLDNLSVGAVALASVCTEARLSELAAANIPADVDTLLSRLSAARAGYLDYLNSRLVGTIAAGTHNPQSGDAYARIGAPAGASIAADLVVIDDFVDALETRCTELRLAELDSGNLPTDIADIYNRIGAPAGASIAADLVVIDDFVDALETRCTEARLSELDAANIPADIDTLLTRISALRAGYIDNLSGGAVALASELSKVLGASAGKKVISADGLQVEVYDESDVLLVTLDRTGAGPYTWTPTWE